MLVLVGIGVGVWYGLFSQFRIHTGPADGD